MKLVIDASRFLRRNDGNLSWYRGVLAQLN